MANQKRKVFATTASAALAASAVAPTAAFAAPTDSTDFPDLDKDQKFASQVQDLVDAGVIEGYTDGTFQPGNKVTRAEVSKMMYEILDMDENAVSTDFPDVKEDVWYSDPINALYEEGHIKGYPDGEFKPGDQMTRAQFAKLVVEAYDLDIEKADTPFTDVKDDVWYTDYIETLYANDLIEGRTATEFGPNDTIKRLDLAGLLANTDYRFGSKLPKPDEDVPGFEINSVDATANKDYTVDVSGEVSGADRVTVTIDGVEKTAELDEDGNYEFTSEALDIGTYEVTVKAHLGDESVSETTKVAVVDEDTSISGFVTDEDDNGVSGATVEAKGAENEEVTTDENGFYQFKGLQTDKYYDVEVTKSNYATQTEEKVRVADDRTSVAMFEQFESIDQADIEITGSVQDQVTGEDVNSVTVELQAYSDELDEWVTVSEKETGDADNVEAENLNDSEFAFGQGDVNPGNFLEFDGEYKLVFSNADYHSVTTDVTVTDEAQVTEINPVEMQEIGESTLTGTVEGAEGAKAANVKLSLGNKTVHTNENGVYEFKGDDKLKLPAGEYVLEAQYTEGAGGNTVSTETVSIEEGNANEKDMTLAYGTEFSFELDAVAGKELKDATNENEEDDSGINAVVYNSDGAAVASSNGEVVNKSDDEENDKGKAVAFNFDNNLRADSYKVEVNGDYVQKTEYDFEVTETDVNDYTQADEKPVLEVLKEASISPAGKITGATDSIKVSNPGDSNPEDDTSTEFTHVLLKDESGIVAVKSVISEDDSSFEFGGLAKGDYTLELAKPGYKFNHSDSDNKVSVSESEDTNVDTNELEMVVPTQESSVQGVVRDADTKAEIENADVTFYQNGVEQYNFTAEQYKGGEAEVDPGMYTVVVRGDASNEYKTYHEELTLKNKQDLEDHHFDLQEGAAQIDTTVVDSDNQAVENSTVTVYDAWGQVRKENLSTDEENNNVVSDNQVIFENLSTGEFSLEVDHDDYVEQSLGVALSDNEDFQTKFTMESPEAVYPVDVTFVGADNADKVVVFDKDGNIVNSNAGASFDLPNGSYTVAAYTDGNYVSTQDFEINREGVSPVIEVEEGNWK